MFVLLALSACAPAEPEKPVIRIAYLPITHALPVLMERELARDSGLRVELVRYGSWPELMDALNTGRVDGASVLSVLAVKAREQGIGLKMRALGHRGGNVLVVAPRIAKAGDLTGGTIAVPHRQSSHHLLVRQMLEQAGLPVDAVKIVELSPPEMPAALAGGTIDAYCVAEPFGAQAVALNAGKVLYHADDLWPNALCCSLVFNEAFLNNNAELAKAYMFAYLQAGKTVAKDPDRARIVAERELKASGKALDMSLGWISFDDLIIHEQDYARLTELMALYGLSQAPPPYRDMVAPLVSTPPSADKPAENRSTVPAP